MKQSSANIVIVTTETAGRVAISCELARRLESTGHSVRVGCLADIGNRVAALGQSFVHLNPDDSSRATGRSQAGAEPDVTQLGLELAALEADLILVDIEVALVVMAAAATDARIALWTSLFSVWKRPGLPPLHTAIVPGQGWQGSPLGIQWAWLRYRIGRWVGRQRGRVRNRGADRISRLRHAAALTGFPFRDETMLHEWLVPFTYRRLPVLSFNTRELELPHEPHPSLSYVGPVLRRTPLLPDQEGIRVRLDELYSRRERGAASALIYCAFGAWHKGDDSAFVRRVIDAVAAEPSWDVVIGLGGRSNQASLGEIPANVHLFDWAPQGEVIAKADIAIHHAGVTSVNECVSAGVPMVLYPFDFLDQRGNAARVAFHRLGVVGDRTEDSAAAIRRRVRSVLDDTSYVESVRRMSAHMARDHTENKPVEAILALLPRAGE